MVLQKPIEHIKSDDVDIDSGIGSIDYDKIHLSLKKFMDMSEEERDLYIREIEERNHELTLKAASYANAVNVCDGTWHHTGLIGVSVYVEK